MFVLRRVLIYQQNDGHSLMLLHQCSHMGKDGIFSNKRELDENLDGGLRRDGAVKVKVNISFLTCIHMLRYSTCQFVLR